MHVLAMMQSMDDTDVILNAQDTWICLKTADFIRTLPTPVVTLWNVLNQHLPPTLLRLLLQDNPTPTLTPTPTPTHSLHTILPHSQLQSQDVLVSTRDNSTSKDSSGMMAVTSPVSVRTVSPVCTDATKGAQHSRLHPQSVLWFLIPETHFVARSQSAPPQETTTLLLHWSFREEKPLLAPL